METCEHCEPEFCSVLLFSKELDWGRENYFCLNNCQITVVDSRSALTAYLTAIKELANCPDKLSEKEKELFNEQIQKDIIVLDCSLKEANKLLECFVQSDNSFPREVILVHRNYGEDERRMSFSRLKGIELALEPISYHGDLSTALSEQIGFSLAS